MRVMALPVIVSYKIPYSIQLSLLLFNLGAIRDNAWQNFRESERWGNENANACVLYL
jgi:hypothetical protein